MPPTVLYLVLTEYLLIWVFVLLHFDQSEITIQISWLLYIWLTGKSTWFTYFIVLFSLCLARNPRTTAYNINCFCLQYKSSLSTIATLFVMYSPFLSLQIYSAHLCNIIVSPLPVYFNQVFKRYYTPETKIRFFYMKNLYFI